MINEELMKEKIYSISAESYSFNHLQLNDVEPELLRVMLIEAFRRITMLEEIIKELESVAK